MYLINFFILDKPYWYGNSYIFILCLPDVYYIYAAVVLCSVLCMSYCVFFVYLWDVTSLTFGSERKFSMGNG